MEKTPSKQYFLILNNNLPQKFHRKTNRSSSKSLQSHAQDDQLKNFYVKNLRNRIQLPTTKQNIDNAQKILKKKVILGTSKCNSPEKKLINQNNQFSVIRKNNFIFNSPEQEKLEKMRVDQSCQVNTVQKHDQDYWVLMELNKQLQNQIKALTLQLQLKDKKILDLQENQKQLSEKILKFSQSNQTSYCGDNSISTVISFGYSSQNSFFNDDSEITNHLALDLLKHQQSIFKFNAQIKALKIQLQCQRRKSHLQAQIVREKKDKQISALKKKYSNYLSKYKEQMKKTFSQWAYNLSSNSQKQIQLEYSSDDQASNQR